MVHPSLFIARVRRLALPRKGRGVRQNVAALSLELAEFPEQSAHWAVERVWFGGDIEHRLVDVGGCAEECGGCGAVVPASEQVLSRPGVVEVGTRFGDERSDGARAVVGAQRAERRASDFTEALRALDAGVEPSEAALRGLVEAAERMLYYEYPAAAASLLAAAARRSRWHKKGAG